MQVYNQKVTSDRRMSSLHSKPAWQYDEIFSNNIIHSTTLLFFKSSKHFHKIGPTCNRKAGICLRKKVCWFTNKKSFLRNKVKHWRSPFKWSDRKLSTSW